MIKKCQEANYIQENITKIKNRIVCDVNFDNDIFKIENNFSSIKEAEQKLKTARGLYKKIRVFSNSFIQQEKDLELAEIEFEKLKEDLGVCPLCGGELWNNIKERK